ncbi:MAG: hypothetical protein ACI4SL_02310 [Candidatus Ornithospirochaeta sp.]
MTRFEKELSGALGEYWKREAEKELDNIRKDLDEGRITIDEAGVARNCVGRALQNDMLEKLAMVTDRVDVEATRRACEEEAMKAFEAYRANYTGPSEEELFEMRAAYGRGTTVVDVITGRKIKL